MNKNTFSSYQRSQQENEQEDTDSHPSVFDLQFSNPVRYVDLITDKRIATKSSHLPIGKAIVCCTTHKTVLNWKDLSLKCVMIPLIILMGIHSLDLATESINI